MKHLHKIRKKLSTDITVTNVYKIHVNSSRCKKLVPRLMYMYIFISINIFIFIYYLYISYIIKDK